MMVQEEEVMVEKEEVQEGEVMLLEEEDEDEEKKSFKHKIPTMRKLAASATKSIKSSSSLSNSNAPNSPRRRVTMLATVHKKFCKPHPHTYIFYVKGE